MEIRCCCSHPVTCKPSLRRPRQHLNQAEKAARRLRTLRAYLPPRSQPFCSSRVGGLDPDRAGRRTLAGLPAAPPAAPLLRRLGAEGAEEEASAGDLRRASSC